MSSRALRKAQRALEEKRQIEESQQEDDENEGGGAEQDTLSAPVRSGFGAFALLNDADGESGEAEATSSAEERSKDDDYGPRENRPMPHPAKRKKKSKKSARDKSQQISKAVPLTDVDSKADEIEQALKELAEVKLHENKAEPVIQSQKTLSLCQAIAVDTSHLHAANEMRRLFGRAAMDDGGDDDGDAGGRRGRHGGARGGMVAGMAGRQGAGGRLATLALRRNIFVQGKEDWPRASSGGLGMEVISKDAEGITTYSYVHSQAYREVQRQFAICVEAGDPQQMIGHLSQNPYHVSSLLQVSEIAKNMDRDHATAGDLLERALFALGRSVHSTFAKALAQGKARLDFQKAENRELWLAGWRYIENLSMRATWRTVLEWAKLLLSLDPDQDPYCMRLVIDQYACRARQPEQVSAIILDVLSPVLKDRIPPHLAYTSGLAQVQAGQPAPGREQLKRAIATAPWIAARLFQELNLEPTPPAVWGKQAPSDLDQLYAELYAVRAKDLWNTPEATSLLMSVGHAVDETLTSQAKPSSGDIDFDIARHVLLTDKRELITLIPRRLTELFTSVSDPLPPEYATSIYTAPTFTADGHGVMALDDASRAELNRLHEHMEALGPQVDLLPGILMRREDEMYDTDDSDEAAPQIRRQWLEDRFPGVNSPRLQQLADDVGRFLSRGGSADLILHMIRESSVRGQNTEPEDGEVAGPRIEDGDAEN